MVTDDVPTFAHEDQLPRVPLPTLEETADRFLAWCAPLLTPDELTSTEAAVAELLAPGSPAHALHADLVAYDARPDVASWLDDFWCDRYLGRRDRIALNANFFFLFQDAAPGQDRLGQIERAAHLAAAAVAFKASVDDETLPAAQQRGRLLSMHQYRFLFSATRIPGEPRDCSRNPYSDDWPGPSRERHIVVLHRGAAVRLDVIDPDGRPYTAEEIATGLRAIMQEAPGDGVGALTSKARPQWAASRAALLDAGNADVLDELERALFCVVLEDFVPDGPLAASDQLLHGDAANRWFDKAVSLVVFADGRAGINGEHCNLDGTTIVAFLDVILSAPYAAGGTATPATRRLEFVLDDALRADIVAARTDFAAYAAATATSTLTLDFDAERAKALKCSPDAFAQMAFQLAHQRAKGHLGATYESIATRAFRHGRTEAMRVVTPEVVEFVAAMADPAADAQTRRDAFRAAADAHVARAKECQVGLAPEQHLWELQLRQQRQGGGPAMAVFDSPGWRIMRDDYLSTSAVPSGNIQYFGFGSTSEKCLGVGYAMLPDRFDLYLSTPATGAGHIAAFARELPVVVRELESMLADGGYGTRTGEQKTDFSTIYAQPDPRAYFRALRPLGYQIPQHARPVVESVLGRHPGAVLDVCCSYGINAALLRFEVDLASLGARAADPARAGVSPDDVVAADAELFSALPRRADRQVFGLDASKPAVDYAVSTGLLAAGWAENLEEADPSPSLVAALGGVSLVLCTGGVGYVGPATFERLVAHAPDAWVLAFVLRVFPYDDVAAALADHGLVTEKLPGTFPQRRFADSAEAAAALHDVTARGLDPAGREADGWFHAEAYLSRPAREPLEPARLLPHEALHRLDTTTRPNHGWG